MFVFLKKQWIYFSLKSVPTEAYIDFGVTINKTTKMVSYMSFIIINYLIK